jgi:(2Fe-2S) ferredoxin
MSRFEKHLFICNNQREEGDERGCCALRGANDLLDHAKKRIHALGLKGRVRINKAGCLDACGYGPAMVIYPDDVWYAPKNREDMDEIIDRHVRGGERVERLLIDFPRK